MQKHFLIYLTSLIYATVLSAETVEIVSNMYTEEILREECFKKTKEFYTLNITDQAYPVPITTDYDNIARYLIFNMNDPIPELTNCPPEKKVLVMMEPIRIPPDEALNYSRVYTWDDDFIDNQKYFKYYFPDLMPMQDNKIAFEDKKLCTMVVRNWSAEHRIPIIAFFSAKPKGEFEFYGSPLPRLLYSHCYKGRISGLNCGKEKIAVLNQYRFCFCIENRVDLRGYISEKIFPCFASGCIPIYWGAPNIEDYIPKSCYIDYRDFQTHEELYQYMKSMSQEVHQEYLNNIQLFLNSQEAHLFSPHYFSETMYEAVSQLNGS